MLCYVIVWAFGKVGGKRIYLDLSRIDFVDTYFLVAKFISFRIIMSIMDKMDIERHQLDIKIIFLNKDLKKDIYIKQHEGFRVEGYEVKVYKLKQFLYGLK